ncbi:MAG: Mur ligase domain-containing protein [Victivallaceae bacterium]|nr:Mur ligase domain-containing protein [Victivallaceae bacterium]
MTAFTCIHFVGIGGAGMAPLAAIVLERGGRVTGSDRESNHKTAYLSAHGAQVTVGHAAGNLPDAAALLVYSSAVGDDNPERVKARRLGIPELRRGEFLSELVKAYSRVTAISGSHGKSSVTAMIAHILNRGGMNPGFMIGAELSDGGMSSAAGCNDDIFVTEADESDGTHKLLKPYLAVIPNIEDDHAWSVGGREALYANFAELIGNSRHVIGFAGPVTDGLFAAHGSALRLTPPPGDVFDVWRGFQARNAMLAVEAAVLLGMERNRAVELLRDFKGVARRVTVRYESPELTIIEDYAHHPTEVANSISFLRAGYPDHHLRVLFQPHRYARLARYLDDLAKVLREADSCLVTPVFAAWCERGGVDSQTLVDHIGPTAATVTADWPEVAGVSVAAPADGRPLLLAVIGAGDIDRVFAFLPGAEPEKKNG